jgi:hypothetical protein
VRRALGAPKIGVFQETSRKCLESDNGSVFHMALCVAYFIVLTLINDNDHQERELRKLVVETHLGRF